MRESSDLLTLGLLFGEDVDAISSDLPEVLSFQHKLIQEMVAAYYIAEKVKVDPSFLELAFPTWKKVEEHQEVVKFTCGLVAQNAAPVINYVAKMNLDIISRESENTDESAVIQGLNIKDPYAFLATAYPTSEKILEHEDRLRFICKLLVESHTDATPLVNHVAEVYVREIWEALNRGKIASVIDDNRFMYVMQTLQNAGKVLNVNPYLCWYPEYCGGLPLAEVLTNTKLAVITDVEEDDPLNVQHSTADVILNLQDNNKETCSKLVKALHSAQPNLLALKLDECDTDEDAMEELAAYIDSLGPLPQLRYCYLGHYTSFPIPSSMLTSLSKCKQLRCLDMENCDLGSRLHILLSDPLPQLRVLVLDDTRLCAEDVEQIADCARRNKLPHLRVLDINENHHLGSRLHILISDPPPQLRELELQETGLCAEDVEQIANCVRRNKLPHLRKLNISYNSVGEEAVRGLLEAFLTTRRQSEPLNHHVTNVTNEYTPHAPSHMGETHSDQDKVDKINNMEECCDDVSGDEGEEDEKLVLDVRYTAAVGEDERHKRLSDGFIKEWKHKLKNTNIEVHWKIG